MVGLEPIDESDPVLKENKVLRDTLTELRAELGRAVEAIAAL